MTEDFLRDIVLEAPTLADLVERLKVTQRLFSTLADAELDVIYYEEDCRVQVNPENGALLYILPVSFLVSSQENRKRTDLNQLTSTPPTDTSSPKRLYPLNFRNR